MRTYTQSLLALSVIAATVCVNTVRSQSVKRNYKLSVTAYCMPWNAHTPVALSTVHVIRSAREHNYVYRLDVETLTELGAHVMHALQHRSDPPERLCWDQSSNVRLVVVVRTRRHADTLSFTPGLRCMQLNDRFIDTDCALLRAFAYQLPYWLAIEILNDPYVRNH